MVLGNDHIRSQQGQKGDLESKKLQVIDRNKLTDAPIRTVIKAWFFKKTVNCFLLRSMQPVAGFF